MAVVKHDVFNMKRNLIVNFLPPSFSQHDVQRMFDKIKPVTNCKLMRNVETVESLGYAFVEFPDEESAERALNELNGIQLMDKVIKVSYARQSTPEIKNANVYIAGLPDWTTEDELFSMFAPFGSILSHKVLRNADGTSRGAGFVRFSLNSEATYAINEMAGKIIPTATCPLTVKLAIPPAAKQNAESCIKNEHGLSSSFIGMTASSNVRYNPIGKPISYKKGVESSVVAALSQQSSNQCSSIYVYGLQESHTELTLYRLFSPFGGIANVKLIRNLKQEGTPCKGYGFVNYNLGEDALNAVAKMNGVHFEDKVLQVSLKTKIPYQRFSV